jgi:hypothetical protein
MYLLVMGPHYSFTDLFLILYAMKRSMRNKLLTYSILPVMALMLIGAGTVSAHGLWGMNNLTPDEIATRQQTMFTQEANLLGISVDEVKTAWAQGKTLKELATEKGITNDQLKQKMMDMRKAELKNQLKTLVEKGVITQAQADQRTSFIEKQITTTQNGKITKGMMHGLGHGFGL